VFWPVYGRSLDPYEDFRAPAVGQMRSVRALSRVNAAAARDAQRNPMKRHGRTLTVRASHIALALLPLLAACGSANPDEVLETVRATEQSQMQAIVADDLRGAVRNYEVGAVVLVPGGSPVTGGPAIEAEFGRLLGDANFAIAMEPGPGWAAASGELAVTTATGTVTTTGADGEAVTVPISNQTVWRREDGVGWKIASEHNAPLPTAEPAPEG
jgi:ketosteroid isomerase-like protein